MFHALDANLASDQKDKRRLAPNIFPKFKKYDKLAKIRGENLHEFFDNYEDDCMDYSFAAEKKLNYLLNLFDSKSKKAYQEHVYKVCHFYAKSCDILLKNLNDTNRQMFVVDSFFEIHFSTLF